MENKDILIAQAAMQQLSKFGLRKTTMQDVADAAEISRQTLYNCVPNKDALLRLVARFYFNDNIHRCETALRAAKDLQNAFEILIDHFVVEPWRTVKSMPEAEEFELASSGIIAEEVRLAVQKKSIIIKDTIVRLAAPADIADQQAEEIANLFCVTADGIKGAADSEKQLSSLCKTMNNAMVAVTAAS